VAGESITFDFVGRGADQLADSFKKTGDNATLAAKGARLCADALSAQRKAADTSAGATLALAKADQILADAEDELAGRAALADEALRSQGDAAQKAGRDAAEASGGFSALAGDGGIPGGGIGAAIAAGVALSPVIITAGVGLAGFAAAAVSAGRPILAAAQATGGLKANMSGLNPEQQQVAKGLLGLQGSYSSFTKSLQPEVFSAFNSGLGIAKTLLAGAAPVAQSASKALDGVLADLGADLKTTQWQQFFTFMATTAGPDVTMLGTAFTSLLNVLPGVLEDLQPVAEQMLSLVTNFTSATSAVVNFGKSNNQVSASVGTNTGVLGLLSRAVANVSAFMKPGGVLAGSYKSAMDAIPGSTGKAAAATAKLATAQQNAKPSTTSLTADVQILGSDTATAANQTTALTDAWNILVGNFASSETAVLNARQAVATFATDVKQAGAGSLTAKLGFESAVTSIGQMVTALQSAHTPARTIYNDLLSQISALQKSGPLNTEETRQLTGMKAAADAVATSTDGWTKATKASAAAIQANLLPQLASMHANTPKVRSDVDDLVDSIVNTGTKSAASHGARQQLITDLETAGVSATKAKGLVDQLQASINAMHGKTVTTVVEAQGSGTISIQGSGWATGSGNIRFHAAQGAYVNAGSGPTADDVLARVSRGELIVPAGMVRAGAVDHLRGKIPGFAAGGLVGLENSIAGAVPAAAAFAGNDSKEAVTAGVTEAMAAARKLVAAKNAAAAAASAGIGAPGGLGGPVSADALAAQAYARSRLGAYGWSIDQMADLIELWNQESGWNRFALNPSSGAYGIPQALPASKMGAAANPPTSSAAAQINWGLSYIKGRYGSPAGAEAHEIADHWYARGGLIPGFASGGTVPARGAAYLKAWQSRRGGGFGAAWGPIPVNPQIDAMTAAQHRAAVLAGSPGLTAAQHRHYTAAAADEKKRVAALTSERATERSWRTMLGTSDTHLTASIHAAGSTKSLAKNVTAWKKEIATQKATIGKISAMLGLTGTQQAAATKAAAAKAAAAALPAITHTYGGDVANNLGAVLASALGPFTGAARGALVSYDQGGWLRPGVTMAYNGTGRPEQVTPARGGGRGGVNVALEIDGTGSSAFDSLMVQWVRKHVKIKGGGDVQRAFGTH
jgi:hypothetical protein